MGRIHVLVRKEEIDFRKLTHCTVVIIDVLLATSTIATILAHKATEVIPVIDQLEAIEVASRFTHEPYIITGEKNGYTLDGFVSPCPLALIRSELTEKSIIFSTTNGTVAIKQALAAPTLYTSSLLNGAAVARQINDTDRNCSLLIVCSGSNGRFAMEDVLGAGYLISELHRHHRVVWSLSDSARAALQLYRYHSDSLELALSQTETGIFLSSLGYEEAIGFVSRTGCYDVVPRLVGNRLVCGHENAPSA